MEMEWNGMKLTLYAVTLNVADNALKSNNQSLYNETNVEIVVALIENMIKQNGFISNQIIIFTFYRARLKLYQQTLHNIILNVSKIDEIVVKTINFMQNNESILIIINVVIIESFKSIRLKNRVNVACFQFKNDLMIIANVREIMKFQKIKRFHFEKVFQYVKDFYAEHEFVKQISCKYLFSIFKRKCQNYDENRSFKNDDQFAVNSQTKNNQFINDNQSTKENQSTKNN